MCRQTPKCHRIVKMSKMDMFWSKVDIPLCGKPAKHILEHLIRACAARSGALDKKETYYGTNKTTRRKESGHQEGRSDRHHRRGRIHRRQPRALLQKERLHQHPRGGQEAALRMVSARARRPEPLPGREHRGQLPSRLRRRGGSLQSRRRHGRHGFHRTFPRRMPAQRFSSTRT